MRLSLIALVALPLLACQTNRSQVTHMVPVADMHSDIINRALNHGLDLGDTVNWPQALLMNLEAGGVADQVFAIWTDSEDLEGFAATSRALRMIGLHQQQMERHRDRIALATTVAEAREIQDSGRIAAWLFMEGGAPIDSDLDLLREFYGLGIRGMGLTWFNNLPWAGSSTDPDNPEMGLTDFGREVVRTMNEMGMIIDLSHASDQTFWDTLAVTTDPVVVSHSNCRALCDHPRNVTDEMLRAIAENGGVIGINALPTYLSTAWEPAWDATAEAHADEIDALAERHGDRGPEFREDRRRLIQQNLPEEGLVTLDTYLDHMCHAIEVAGVEHVGLGADFDGIWAFPEGLERPSKFQAVAQGLRDRGYTEAQVRMVMHGNVLRVFEQVLDN